MLRTFLAFKGSCLLLPRGAGQEQPLFPIQLCLRRGSWEYSPVAGGQCFRNAGKEGCGRHGGWPICHGEDFSLVIHQHQWSRLKGPTGCCPSICLKHFSNEIFNRKTKALHIITIVPWYPQRIGSRTGADTKICGCSSPTVSPQPSVSTGSASKYSTIRSWLNPRMRTPEYQRLIVQIPTTPKCVE